ncbi:MAG: sigma-70 family RNA polymerase sigma factor, partial [Oscillospiraceae bacterium]|nr:sigma-70 family RNA polymerase sigma factor [Oscillospiraceae bacterium]
MFTALFSLVLSSMLLFSLHLESRTLPKPLTQKEEKEEFEKYHNGDSSARDRLIRHNLRLVAHVAKKYYANPQDNEDLMSIGTIGLIKAVQNFSYEKNTRFSTYRAKCIENAILSQ